MSYLYRISYWILLLGTPIAAIFCWKPLNHLIQGMSPTGGFIAAIAAIAAIFVVLLGLIVLHEMTEHHQRLEWRASRGIQD